MKTIKIIGILSIYFLGRMFVVASPLEDNRQHLEQVRSMKGFVQEQGLRSFLSNSKMQKWDRFKIYSEWYINRLPDDDIDQKELYRAESALGLVMAQELTKAATIVIQTKDSAQLEEISAAMIDFISWLDVAPGYGNIFLQARASDIACIAITKLIADINYPIALADKLKSRLSFDWDSPERRRQILFDESSGTHFRTILDKDIQEELINEWVKYFDPSTRKDINSIDKDLQIFRSPKEKLVMKYGKPETYWDSNFHEKIILPLKPMSFENIQILYDFRKKYGQFPTKPSRSYPAQYGSEIEIAFIEMTGSNSSVIDVAAFVYTQYTNGRLKPAGDR